MRQPRQVDPERRDARPGQTDGAMAFIGSADRPGPAGRAAHNARWQGPRHENIFVKKLNLMPGEADKYLQWRQTESCGIATFARPGVAKRNRVARKQTTAGLKLPYYICLY